MTATDNRKRALLLLGVSPQVVDDIDDAARQRDWASARGLANSFSRFEVFLILAKEMTGAER